MSGSERHWFDRLAARHTRRDLLRAALVGGATLALPAITPAAAQADDPHACQIGCGWTAHQTYLSRSDTCATVGSAAAGYFTLQLGAAFGIFNPVGAFTGAVKAGTAVDAKCTELALQLQKGDYYDCLQPDCPGFDPKEKGGPCETCTASCCPDGTVVSGYSCCALGCASGPDDFGACHS